MRAAALACVAGVSAVQLKTAAKAQTFTYDYDSLSAIVDTPMTARANHVLQAKLREAVKAFTERKPVEGVDLLEERASERASIVSMADRLQKAENDERTLEEKLATQ